MRYKTLFEEEVAFSGFGAKERGADRNLLPPTTKGVFIILHPEPFGKCNYGLIFMVSPDQCGCYDNPCCGCHFTLFHLSASFSS